jgi:hypothetical protein
MKTESLLTHDGKQLHTGNKTIGNIIKMVFPIVVILCNAAFL